MLSLSAEIEPYHQFNFFHVVFRVNTNFCFTLAASNILSLLPHHIYKHDRVSVTPWPELSQILVFTLQHTIVCPQLIAIELLRWKCTDGLMLWVTNRGLHNACNM